MILFGACCFFTSGAGLTGARILSAMGNRSSPGLLTRLHRFQYLLLLVRFVCIAQKLLMVNSSIVGVLMFGKLLLVGGLATEAAFQKRYRLKSLM